MPCINRCRKIDNHQPASNFLNKRCAPCQWKSCREVSTKISTSGNTIYHRCIIPEQSYNSKHVFSINKYVLLVCVAQGPGAVCGRLVSVPVLGGSDASLITTESGHAIRNLEVMNTNRTLQHANAVYLVRDTVVVYVIEPGC